MPLDALTRRLRTLADPLRLRILNLLSQEEVTVTELTRIVNCGQSRVSGHLSRLAEEGFVAVRREGRYTYYAAAPVGAGPDAPLVGALLERARTTEEAGCDGEALAAVLAERPKGPPPGTLGRDYLPGRTWEGFAKALLAVLPPLRIADVGIGRGEITLLLAEAATGVVAVDADPDVLARARVRAERAGLADRIAFRQGTAEEPPVGPGEVDGWLLSQVLHDLEEPLLALRAARDRLHSGGRVVVLDLLAHQEEWVRPRLGHRHLGFTEGGLAALLEEAGLDDVTVRRAARDRKPPHFVTLLGRGRRP